jgi:hypothetical protein
VFCFTCNSRDDKTCSDPFHKARHSYVDCSGTNFKVLVDESATGITEVQGAFQAYPSVAHSNGTCQKLVIKGKSYVQLSTKFLLFLYGDRKCLFSLLTKSLLWNLTVHLCV